MSRRRNVAALGADYALFMIGLSFASQSTILPAFAAHLGAPNVVIGAIPAVMTLGWHLPSLFTAGPATSISSLNVLLEFAPVPEERPTYVGLGTTLMAPVAFGAPLAAGLVADSVGFTAVFAAAPAAGAIGLALLVWRVSDPRHLARVEM